MQQFDSEDKDESIMILLDISVLFLYSWNPVSILEVIAAVFLQKELQLVEARGAALARGLGVTNSSRCPVPETPASPGEGQEAQVLEICVMQDGLS